jgi:hypothetical protein
MVLYTVTYNLNFRTSLLNKAVNKDLISFFSSWFHVFTVLSSQDIVLSCTRVRLLPVGTVQV